MLSLHVSSLVKEKKEMKKLLFIILLVMVILNIGFSIESNNNIASINLKSENIISVKNKKLKFSPEWLSAIASVVSSISTVLIIIQIRKSSKDKIEDRLFRLIDLHKKNVDDLMIIDSKTMSGQEIIMKICNEVNFIIHILDINPNCITDFNEKDKKVFAYLFLCHGIALGSNPWFKSNYVFKKYAKEELIELVLNNITSYNSDPDNSDNLLLFPRNGFINVISRYFRQLFQIIKFIDEQKFISKKEKYQYIKILRSSLTNREEEFIFDNSISPYGSAWIEKKYFLKYKIIKNIPFYYIYGYDPVTWFIDEFNISQKDVSKYFEHYEYKEA